MLSTPSSSDAHSIQNLNQELPGQIATKLCYNCKTVKPISEYNKNSCRKDGLQYECKVCQSEGNSKRARANPFAALLSNVKSRAKERGWDFDIDEDYVRSLDCDICPYLKEPIYWRRGYGKHVSIDSKSLDRIDSAKGYVRGNLIICSMKANRLKSDLHPEELFHFASHVLRVFNSTQPTDATTEASD
jgi:hypothetical protein